VDAQCASIIGYIERDACAWVWVSMGAATGAASRSSRFGVEATRALLGVGDLVTARHRSQPLRTIRCARGCSAHSATLPAGLRDLVAAEAASKDLSKISFPLRKPMLAVVLPPPHLALAGARCNATTLRVAAGSA
jgi:hypothetical protein